MDDADDLPTRAELDLAIRRCLAGVLVWGAVTIGAFSLQGVVTRDESFLGWLAIMLFGLVAVLLTLVNVVGLAASRNLKRSLGDDA